MDDKKTVTQLAREAIADRAFAKREAADHRSGVVLADEAKRVSANVLKTSKLRALRESRDADILAQQPTPAPKAGRKRKSNPIDELNPANDD